jgi:hypothetical protein
MKPNTTKSRKGTNLKFIGRAFRSRNYRLFFVGQGVSLVGTWMQQIAMGWLVYRLTNSAFLLGLIGFAGQVSVFVLTSFAGVFAAGYIAVTSSLLPRRCRHSRPFFLPFLS